MFEELRAGKNYGDLLTSSKHCTTENPSIDFIQSIVQMLFGSEMKGLWLFMEKNTDPFRTDFFFVKNLLPTTILFDFPVNLNAPMRIKMLSCPMPGACVLKN
jgi:hypothetical protein